MNLSNALVKQSSCITSRRRYTRDMSRRLWITSGILAGVVIVAAGFRFYYLQNFPALLHPLEAADGEDARLVLAGESRVFYPRAGGREGLFIWLQALAVKTFGIGVWQLH